MKIRQLRGQKGLSIRKLAEQTGIPKSNLADMETGKRLPRSGELEKIADALGVTVEELY